MNRLHLTWLALLAAFTLAFAGCDVLSEDDSGGAPSVKNGTEYLVPDDDSGGGSLMGLMGGAYTMGPNDVVVRIDAAGDGKWVAEDADGKAVFWGTAEVLPSGFIEMVITNSKVSDPAEGTELIAFEVSQGVLFIMGVDSFDNTESAFLDDDTVGFNLDGACPANGTETYNFVQTTDPDTTADQITFGYVDFVTTSGDTDLSGTEQTLNGDLSTGTSGIVSPPTGFSCDTAFAENSGGDVIVFTGAGFNIVFPGSGADAVAFPVPGTASITAASLTGGSKSYAGVGLSHDASGIQRLVAIGAEGQGDGTLLGAPYESVADIISGSIDLSGTNPEDAVITPMSSGTMEHFFDTTTIDVGDSFPTMAMQMANGKVLLMGLIWTDDGNATLDAADDYELIILAEQ